MRLRALSILVLVFVLPLLAVSAYADAVSTTSSDFANASIFAVLGATTVTNTGPTTLGGDLGVSTGLAITGFGSITLTGQVDTGTGGIAAAGQASALTTYNYLSGLAVTALTGTLTGSLDGQTVNATGAGTNAVYNFTSGAALLSGGAVTLNFNGVGNQNIVFVTGSTLTAISGSSVVIQNAAAGDNVYWVVGSAATIGTGVSFAGNIISQQLVAMQTGATDGCGSVISLHAAVTLDTNTISTNSCVTAVTSTSGGGTVPPVVTGTTTTIPLPEPGTLTLLSSGLLAMVFLTFRKSRVSSLSLRC